jgi:hypothetical protein
MLLGIELGVRASSLVSAIRDQTWHKGASSLIVPFGVEHKG